MTRTREKHRPYHALMGDARATLRTAIARRLGGYLDHAMPPLAPDEAEITSVLFYASRTRDDGSGAQMDQR